MIDVERLIKDIKIPKKELADILGKKPSSISNAIDRKTIPYEWIKIIEEKFNVKIRDYEFENEEVTSSLLFEIKPNVLHVPVDLEAGFVGGMNDPVYMRDLEAWYLPGLTGDNFSFRVRGESMKNTLDDGDLVIAAMHPIERKEEIKEGYMYAVAKKDGQMMVKRIKFHKDNSKIWLVSDNQLYKDQDVVYDDEINNLYKVRRLVKWNASMRMK